MSDKQCLFCAIIGKAAHAFIVYENSHTVVFLDSRPINVGHLLIVPTQHVEALYALDEHAFIAFMLVVKRMAALIEALYQPKKVGMLAAGFDVAHAHLHVLPLYDAHDMTSKVLLEGKRAHPTEDDLRRTAERIDVTACNRNESGLQSARFSDHILCLYRPPQNHIICI